MNKLSNSVAVVFGSVSVAVFLFLSTSEQVDWPIALFFAAIYLLVLIKLFFFPFKPVGWGIIAFSLLAMFLPILYFLATLAEVVSLLFERGNDLSSALGSMVFGVLLEAPLIFYCLRSGLQNLLKSDRVI